jgi:iron(III) transport system ATP-binding protein
LGVSFAAGLTFEDIRHRYDGHRETLCGISLDVEPGEVLCLLGPSGSGKTTLLRIASGIEAQTSGRILLNDREIAGPSVFLPPEKRSIGLMFQDFALFPHMNILDNVRFGLTALSSEDSKLEAFTALGRVGLDRHARSYPHVLSGGEQQRVALARALAPRPAVLLMDEPFSGLDSRLKDSVRAEALAVLRQSRATAVVVTHDAEEAMRMADRIALLKDGKLVQAGTAEELFRHPVDLFAAGFFSELNLFDAVAKGGQAVTVVGSVKAQFPDDTPVSVAVRVGAIEASVLAGDLQARVTARRFLGDFELMEFAIPGGDVPVRAKIRCGILPASAKEVFLNFRKSDVLVFERLASNV